MMESIFNKVAGLKEHYGWLLLYIKLMSNVNREIADIYLQYNILSFVSLSCLSSSRSSHRMCSVRKGVLRNFAKFTGKRLCQSLFVNKVAGLRPLFFNKVAGLRSAKL